jgi:hypothetical protein
MEQCTDNQGQPLDDDAVSRRLVQDVQAARAELREAVEPERKDKALAQLKRSLKRLTDWAIQDVPPVD